MSLGKENCKGLPRASIEVRWKVKVEDKQESANDGNSG